MSQPDDHIARFMSTVIGIVSKAEERDYSLRQLGLMLVVYSNPQRQTVRALAGVLNISKPAISRALDRLEGDGMLMRTEDPTDRRSVLIARTPAGTGYMRKLARMILNGAKGLPGGSLPSSTSDDTEAANAV